MLGSFFNTLCSEPPFRIFTAALIKRFSQSLRLKELWDAWERPEYLSGILYGAEQARLEGKDAISVVEFGVAGGRGLLAMQRAALAVQAETGVKIFVYGFDLGSGLCPPSGGFRDHPDKWQAGDFPMLDHSGLISQLLPCTRLILGNVESTVKEFVEEIQQYPLGFVAFDLDYYSSTMHALNIFSLTGRSNLIHAPLYFDDIFFFGASNYAGERLAITEFNKEHPSIKIDPWEILAFGRPFPERRWLKGMYVANDLDQMENFRQRDRPAQVLPL